MNEMENKYKNTYRAHVKYSGYYKGHGKSSNAFGMTLSEVRQNSLELTKIASSHYLMSSVIIYRNTNVYPKFLWEEVERYEVDGRYKKEKTKKITFSVPISKIESFENRVNKIIESYQK